MPAYLTKIIGSWLTWIEDDEVKEQIWETAAQRLSERSGRTGMGDITRVFAIPITSHISTHIRGHDGRTVESGSNSDILRLNIHEPALSEDSLGLKTWAASFLLAKRLSDLDTVLLVHDGEEILELGAGTGLVGLAAAVTFSCPVLLTDLPAIVPNLTRNVEANANEITTRGGSVRTAVLDWSNPGTVIHPNDTSHDESKKTRPSHIPHHPRRRPHLLSRPSVATVQGNCIPPQKE